MATLLTDQVQILVVTTATRTQSGMARITVSVQKTQTGKGRITTVVQRLQTGAARIQVTATKAQNGVARVTAATTKTITGKARIQKSAVKKTRTGKARIQNTGVFRVAKFPTSATNNNAVGTLAWSSPTWVYAEEGNYAGLYNSTATPTVTSNYLVASAYNFAIPSSATITGVEVEVYTYNTASDVSDNEIMLMVGGTIQGLNRAKNTWYPTGYDYYTWGGRYDTWGLALTPADVNSSNFGVALSMNFGTSTSFQGFNIDYIKITVYHDTVIQGKALITASTIKTQTGKAYIQRKPEVTLNTPDNTDFGYDTTPTLEFTGVDPNGDDVHYQLQVSKNSSFTSTVFDEHPFVISGYSTSMPGTATKISQSFQGQDVQLKAAQLMCTLSGVATGTMTAKLYGHSGTYGTDSVPDEILLSTSNSVDLVTVTPLIPYYMTFEFPTPYQLASGTNYTIVFELNRTSGTGSLICYGGWTNNGTALHSGNQAEWRSNSYWQVWAGEDFYFRLIKVTPDNETIILKNSIDDANFINTVNGTDLVPFTQSEKVAYTFPSGQELGIGKYYWRVRARDYNGVNTYSLFPPEYENWSETRSFSIYQTTTKTQTGKAFIQKIPTIVPNTPDGYAFGLDTTPTLEFTGSDENGDDLHYVIQLSKNSNIPPNEFAASTSPSEATETTYILNSHSTLWVRLGQTFEGVNGPLKSVRIRMKKGTVGAGSSGVMSLHPIASGTFGTNSIPDAATILATSATVSYDILQPNFAWVEFVFSTPYTMSAGTNYAFMLTSTFTSGTVNILSNNPSISAASGNSFYSQSTGGTINSYAFADLVYQLFSTVAENDFVLEKNSYQHTGFVNTVDAGDTAPFTAGQKISFTVHPDDALSQGTWYWRALTVDNNGSRVYTDYTPIRFFTTTQVTQQTQTGKASIHKQVNQNQTGLAKIYKTVSKGRMVDNYTPAPSVCNFSRAFTGVGESTVQTQELAQSFTATESYTANAVELLADKTGNPLDYAYLEIRTALDDTPESLLATSDPILSVKFRELSGNATDESRAVFAFPEFNLTQGNEYYIVVKRTGAADIVNYPLLRGTGSVSQYAGGSGWRRINGVWSAEAALDLYFAVFSEAHRGKSRIQNTGDRLIFPAPNRLPVTTSNDTSIGTVAWQSLEEALTLNNIFATATFTEAGVTNYIKWTNFSGNVNIPANAKIYGVSVLIYRKRRDAGVTTATDEVVSLVVNGNVVGNNKADTVTNYATGTVSNTYGSSTDTWGLDLRGSDVNSPNFGLALSIDVSAVSGTGNVMVDSAQMSIWYGSLTEIQGVARIQLATSKSQIGKAAIHRVTTRTQTGISRIYKTVPRTQTGIARIYKTVNRLISGTARIYKTTVRTQTGKAFIQLTTSMQITGKARIQMSVTRTQIGVARIEAVYSRSAEAVLPTTADMLDTPYTAQNRTDVFSSDDIRVSEQSATGYILHQFKGVNNNSDTPISVTWEGQSNIPCYVSAVYLQVYNYNSLTWETVATNTTTDADTDFVLTAIVTDNVQNYYGVGNVVAFRVYQEAIL